MILNILVYLHFKTNDMYEIIEKNEYGVLVREKSIFNCRKCKYSDDKEHSCLKRCDSDMYGYYLTDQEAAKLETELTPETFTINDMYVESKLLFDCQDKLNDLQIENDQLKERIKELESEKTTELIHRRGDITHDYWYYCQECLHDLETDNHNFCPNCGRKIIR